MYITKVKRKCSVRGCKNTESYAVSRRRELGNSVIICESCVSAAKAAIDELDPNQKSNVAKTETKSIPLFFNSVVQSVAQKEKTKAEENEIEAEAEEKKTKKRAEKQ